jgi:hypothetical protein
VTAPQIEIDGGAIATSSLALFSRKGGPAGDLTIHADTLAITGGGRIDSGSYSGSSGGSITVDASRLVSVSGPGSAIVAKTAAAGPGGNVTVRAPRVEVSAGGTISVESTPGFGASRPIFEDLVQGNLVPAIDDPAAIATGNAGTLRLEAESASIEGGSLRTNAPDANGGNIEIQVSDLLRLREAEITANVGGGTGGNITIDPRFVVLDHSRIVAQAGEGRGGAIDIVADFLFRDPTSVIDASAGDPSLSGIVTIRTPETDIVRSIESLPASFLDAAQLLKNRCAARSSVPEGSFVVLPRDGAPAMPDGLLPAATAGATPTASGSLENEPRLLFSGSPDLFAASCP